MKLSTKATAIILCALAVILLSFTLCGCVSNDDGTIGNALGTIKDNPTDIMLYGDGFSLPATLEYRTLDTLNEEALKKNDNYKYSYLIINDLSGNVSLSEAEIQLIHDYIYNQHNSFIYVGEKYLSTWSTSDQNSITVEGNRYIEYNFENGNVVAVIGRWSTSEAEAYKENRGMLGEAIVYAIEDHICKTEEASNTNK